MDNFEIILKIHNKKSRKEYRRKLLEITIKVNNFILFVLKLPITWFIDEKEISFDRMIGSFDITEFREFIDDIRKKKISEYGLIKSDGDSNTYIGFMYNKNEFTIYQYELLWQSDINIPIKNSNDHNKIVNCMENLFNIITNLIDTQFL